MLFLSFFKTLVDQQITVEFKNGIEVTGTLRSVDQFLNIKLESIDNSSTKDADCSPLPYLASVNTLFIRGTGIRYIHLPKNAVDTTLLQDATRKEAIIAKETLAASAQ